MTPDIKKYSALLTSILLLASCGGGKSGENEEKTAQEAIPTVTVEQVFSRTVEQLGQYTSTVQANITNNISPQTSLRIKVINVEIGDFVKKDQVLARMDVASYNQSKLQVANDSTELERVRSLYEVGAVSRSDLDAMELTYRVRRTAFQNLKENTILLSPVDGVVTARNYDVGDMYTMGQPLFTVQQITPVKLLVGVSEKDYTRVKEGGKCTIEVDALPGQTFKGDITLIYPTMDATTHTFNVEVKVPNKDRKLRPGMYADVYLDFGSQNNVVIPDKSVSRLQGSGDRFVYVYNPDTQTVEYRKVELGKRMGKEYEIYSGVSNGEYVVVDGILRVKDGSKVKVEE